MTSRSVTLAPPHTAAIDTDFYLDRLTDPTLLDTSVAVLIGGAAQLAVPVGGQRHGGYLPVTQIVTGLSIRNLLAGRPGFPDIRLRWSPRWDTCHNVEWGERPPHGDADRGRFYGYSTTAIARFLASLPATIPA